MSKNTANPFGTLVRDDNNQVVQVFNSFISKDSSATPKKSPLSYAGSVITLKVPDEAIELNLNPSTSLRVSEYEDLDNESYFVIPANTTTTVPVAKAQYVYLKNDSSSGTLQFWFNCV